jgi:hypothetical protein
MRMAVPVLAVVAVAAIGGAVFFVNGQDAPDLCDSTNAFREWRKVIVTEPYSPARLKVARPVAEALVGCERPLIGMTKSEVADRLGEPDRGLRTNAWAYDLGLAERESVRPGMLIIFTSEGRVRAATAGE